MNTESKQDMAGTKRLLIAVALFIGAFLIYFIVMSSFSPGRELRNIKSKYGISQAKDDQVDTRFFTDSAYVSLYKEKAFLQARVAMAESTAILEINGVKVHAAKMSKLKVSRILLSGDQIAISSMFSTPLTIVRDFSTIRKEPLMIKMAPKDTSEFKPDIIPDTSDFEPVNYILDTDCGLRIFVYQEETTKASDRRRLFFFDLNDRLRTLWRSLKEVLAFKIPDYSPFIKMRLPKADAKILYRAIPRNGQIAVYI
jgi:hypothetical protein